MERVQRIGIVGTSKLRKRDIPFFFWLGRALKRLDHDLLYIIDQGPVTQVREGFELEGGSAQKIGENLIEQAEQTLAFVDDGLLQKMTERYPDIEDSDAIVIIWPEQYEELRATVQTIMAERGITPP